MSKIIGVVALTGAVYYAGSYGVSGWHLAVVLGLLCVCQMCLDVIPNK